MLGGGSVSLDLVVHWTLTNFLSSVQTSLVAAMAAVVQVP